MSSTAGQQATADLQVWFNGTRASFVVAPVRGAAGLSILI